MTDPKTPQPIGTVAVPRAYGTFDLRGQRRATLVYSEDDIQRALTLAAQRKDVLTLELASDIAITKTITVPATLPSFELNGGGRWKLRVRSDVATLFDTFSSLVLVEGVSVIISAGVTCGTLLFARGESVVCQNVNISCDANASVPIVFKCGTSGTVFVTNLDIDLTNKAGTSTLFSISTGGLTTRAVLTTARITALTYLFSEGYSATWVNCRLSDIVLNSAVALTSTALFGGATFKDCIFERIRGGFGVTLGSGSDRNIFFQCTGNSTTVFNTGSVSFWGQTLRHVTGYITRITGGADVDLDSTFTSTMKGIVPASGGGTTNFLRADGTWAAPPGGGGGISDGDKGDVTVSGGGTTWTIDPAVITNAKLANVSTATFKGRTTAGVGSPEDLTGTQATALLDTFTSTLKGLTPASGGGTANFLRADGTWAAPSGSGGLTHAQVLARGLGA
jgi:hypothetical protein